MFKIIAGKWRDDSTGPMQVVSGALGKEKVHFQAPPAPQIENEMRLFLDWFNLEQKTDLVLKAAIAHLWFVTIHPFEDGNGRISRALSDMLLARSDEQSYRFYSMSTQIRKERNSYYDILEKTQKGSLDITIWLEWFLNCLLNAIENSEKVLEKIIKPRIREIGNGSIHGISFKRGDDDLYPRIKITFKTSSRHNTRRYVVTSNIREMLTKEFNLHPNISVNY